MCYCHSAEANYDSAMLLVLSHMPGCVLNAAFSYVRSFITRRIVGNHRQMYGSQAGDV